jgi:hypothetical protein
MDDRGLLPDRPPVRQEAYQWGRGNDEMALQLMIPRGHFSEKTSQAPVFHRAGLSV